jgi:hypothetical protein
MLTDELRAALTTLKINVKSLAEEARINRLEAARTADRQTFFSLVEHRRGPLRKEARYSQLAYAFLRRRPYRRTEAKTRPGNEPCPRRLHKKISRFAAGFELFEIENWLSE